MEIMETTLNAAINEAIQVINNAIRVFNSSHGSPSSRRSRNWLSAPKPRGPPVFADAVAPSRVTKCNAMIGGTLLAVAYKINGKQVPKRDATHCKF